MEKILEGIPVEQLYPYTPFGDQVLCDERDKIFIAADYEEYCDLSEKEIIALLQEGPLVATLSAD